MSIFKHTTAALFATAMMATGTVATASVLLTGAAYAQQAGGGKGGNGGAGGGGGGDGALIFDLITKDKATAAKPVPGGKNPSGRPGRRVVTDHCSGSGSYRDPAGGPSFQVHTCAPQRS
jgi:hypothetical protein